MIDIFVATYQRKELTERCIEFLNERTKFPHRIWVLDNHSTDGTARLLDDLEKKEKIFLSIKMSRNVGIHALWNLALTLSSSKYFVTIDNDIYVPKLEGKCWLEKLNDLMDKNPKFGAIAIKPHVFLGASNLKEAKNGIHEHNMCGAVARIMATEVTNHAGGWEREYNKNRNHEEKTICSRLQTNGFKVGYAEGMTCYHDFGDDNNWGYKDIDPHKHGHRIPGKEIWPMPEMLNNKNLNTDTWEEK